jgi:uncharacterized cupredoxin-like copper-binding protein
MKKQHTFIFSQLIGSVLLPVLALLVVACANTSAVTTAPTATTAGQATAAPTIADVEETPVAGAVTVHVTLKEYSITSSVTTFRVGVPYYFIVANSGHDFHEFLIIPGKVDGKQIPTLQQLNNDLIEIEPVGPGTTQRVNYTFPPAVVGQGGLACLMRGHYMAGMHLSIIITR